MSIDSINGPPPTSDSDYFVAQSSTSSNTGAGTVQGILDIVLSSNINEQSDYVSNLAGQVNTMNIKMANDNAAMETANTCASNGHCGTDTQFTYTDPDTGSTSKMTVSHYCDQNGIKTPKTQIEKTSKYTPEGAALREEQKLGLINDQTYWGKKDWSTVADNLQTDCSTLSSETQQMNVDLQSGMNNLSNAQQLLSTVDKSFTDTNGDVIRNA